MVNSDYVVIDSNLSWKKWKAIYIYIVLTIWKVLTDIMGKCSVLTVFSRVLQVYDYMALLIQLASIVTL